jgi:hypothetical protein
MRSSADRLRIDVVTDDGGAEERFHINPATGLPNKCDDGEDCAFGGAAFHYPNRHDAQVAWRARQLERGVIAYHRVMQAKEKEEEDAALAKLAGKAQGLSKKISWSVVRSVVVKNLSKYLVNFLGVFMAYAVASGKWLTDDWIRRLLPTIATIVLIALVVWFVLKFVKGGRKAAKVVERRRVARKVRKRVSNPSGRKQTHLADDAATVPPTAS